MPDEVMSKRARGFVRAMLRYRLLNARLQIRLARISPLQNLTEAALREAEAREQMLSEAERQAAARRMRDLGINREEA